MVIQGTKKRNDYTGDGSTKIFAYQFLIFDSTHLEVYLDGVLQGSGYTVDNVGNPNGGNVTFTTAPASGVMVTLIRKVPQTQTSDYQVGGDLPAETLERDLDLLVMNTQQLQEILDRAFVVPVEETFAPVTVPVGAGKFLRWNSTADALELIEVSASDTLDVITTEGDLIRGGASGVAERLAKGSQHSLLTVGAARPEWLAPGSNNTFLTMLSGAVGWESQADVITRLGALMHGSVRLDYVSSSVVRLNRYGTGQILVKKGSVWELRQIPSAGIDFLVSGLTPGQLYYLYIYDSSGTLTAEISTTTHATDSTSGVEIKSGDATRTLVGMAMPGSGPIWEASNTTYQVLSYFNRKDIALLNTHLTVETLTNAGTPTEFDSAFRINFLTWGDEIVHATTTCFGYCAGGGTRAYTFISFDGGTVEEGGSKSDGAGSPHSVAVTTKGLSEGSHDIRFYGKVTPSGSGEQVKVEGNGASSDGRLNMQAIIKG